MTVEKFRQLALEIPGAIESAHMGHPDFRVYGKIFASLGYPDEAHGMIKLPPEQQRVFLAQAPEVFFPAKGAWGQQGSTHFRLAAARVEQLRPALAAAAAAIPTPRKKK